MKPAILTHLAARAAFTAALMVALLLGTSGTSSAQDASAKLYAKVQGADLLVAIKVSPGFGSWFYDDGPGEVGGQPTVVTLGGIEGADWSPVLFPEPKTKYDESIDWTSKIFDKATVLYAVARGAGADAPPGDVTADIEGQLCNTSQCVPWTASLTFRSEGTDALWSDFPAALLVAESPGSAADPAGAPTAGASDGAQGEAPQWTPVFAKTDRALARAFARVDSEDAVELVIQVATPDHWHMYAGPTDKEKGPGIGIPTTITVDGGNVDWDEVKHPRPFQYIQTEGDPEGWIWSHEGTFHFGVTGEAYDEFDPESIEILVNGQSCDEGSCVNVNLTPTVEGEGDDALYAAAFASWTLPPLQGSDAIDVSSATGTGVEAAAVEGPKEFGQSTESDSLLAFILLAIGAGLFTLLMPCTYPMIPITISYFTKQAESRGGKVLPLALAYGAGIVAIFVLLGIAAGPIMGQVAGLPITNMIIGIVFVVFAFALFGLINLQPPKFMMNFAGNASTKGGYLGVFLMGLTLVITSFTCTGPFVGSLLAAGSDFGVGHTAIGMGAFGLTMATPFVLLALLPGRLSAIPSAGAWMNTLKVFMGFVELAASLKFFSNADIATHSMILPREVFLVLWAGIAFVAGYYLLGRINLKGEEPDGNIGPGRLLGAVVTILAGFYCLLGTMGYQLDSVIMSAMAPPPTYTRGLVESHTSGTGAAASPAPAGSEYQGGSIVVIDDYDRAREIALENGLGLIANFTAHT
jgi:cytochrome c biogenesis protein CcdA